MKLRFNLLAALAMIVAGTQLAQAQIGIGIQGGYLSSKAKIENEANDDGGEVSDAISGYTIGIPVEISLGDAFAIQVEGNYLRRGYNNSTEVAGVNFSQEFYYNVIEIPVLAKLGYVTERFSIAGVAGPAFNYTASAKAKGSAGGINSEVDIDFDDPNYDDINRSNFYGIAGVQLGVPIGIGKFVVDGRYRFQLNDEDGGDDINVRGRGVSATAGLIFTLGDY